MKKIMTLGLMLIALSMPIVANASIIDDITVLILPEYHGDINDPGITVIEKGDEIWVVKINGNIYVFKANK
jgi:hypothetical protein